MKIILVIVTAIVFILGWSVFRRKQALIRWANDISLSKNQILVLEQLASAEQSHAIPAKDPINMLSSKERGELIYLTSPSAPPKKLIKG